MMHDKYPRLIFPDIESKQLQGDLEYVEIRGYCTIAMLEAEEGVVYPISFVTPERASMEMKIDAMYPYYIEPGLIIVPDTTLATMQAAAIAAWKEGFFKTIVPQ